MSSPSSSRSAKLRQIEQANASGKTAGRLHPRPLAAAEQLGQLGAAVRGGRLRAGDPDWPDDPETVEEARANPDVFAKKTLEQVADHTAEVIGELDKKPAVMGHSTGGLLAQIIADRGPVGRDRGDRPWPVPRRAAAADLGAAIGRPGAAATRSTAAAR